MTSTTVHTQSLPSSFRRSRLVAVAIGGSAGALCRAGLAEALPAGDGWPWGTFIANMAGTVILAWLFAYLVGRSPTVRLWRLLLGTGFCGALTTFSTFQVEVIDLARHDRPGLAVAYTGVTLVLGLTLAIAAAGLGREMSHG